MNVTTTASTGVVNKDTIFEFEQIGNIVSAKYSGGKIAKGYLIGLLSNNILEFRYTQVQNNSILDGGYSKCEVELLKNGKIKLIEKFNWESRDGSGENIFEEVE